jgi:hypothetical protein
LLRKNWAPVAHTCNPSYSGDRDQEDCGSKPEPDKKFVRPYGEKTHHKIGLAEWLKQKECLPSKCEALSSNSKASKKKKKSRHKKEKMGAIGVGEGNGPPYKGCCVRAPLSSVLKQ